MALSSAWNRRRRRRRRMRYVGFSVRISEVFHTGSRVHKIPDPGSASESKNFSIFNPENCFSALGKIIWDVHPGSRSGFFPIPDPGVKKAPDPGFGSATLVGLPPKNARVDFRQQRNFTRKKQFSGKTTRKFQTKKILWRVIKNGAKIYAILQRKSALL